MTGIELKKALMVWVTDLVRRENCVDTCSCSDGRSTWDLATVYRAACDSAHTSGVAYLKVVR